MRLLANLKISVAISLLVAGAFIAIAMLSSQIIIRDINNMREVSELSQLSSLAIKTSSLLHENQKERAYTGVFVGSKGEKFKSEMETQRAVVDKKKQEVLDFVKDMNRQVYGKEFNEKLDDMLSDLSKQEGIRSSASSLSIELPDAIGYYTKLNGKMIDLVGYMPNLSHDPQISLAIVSFANFMKGKEYTGIERAVAGGGFSTGNFTPAIISKLRELIAMQNAYKTVFLSYASAEQKSLFDKVLNDQSAKDVAKMEAIALDNDPEQVKTVQATVWTDTITKKINGMREVEESFANALANEMEKSTKDAKQDQIANFTMLGIVVALITVFSYVMARAIISSLNKVAAATESLADGKLDTVLPPRTNNEVGKIFAALEVFKENALQVAKLKVEQEARDKAAAEEKRRAMHQMADNFEASVKAAVSHVASSATQMQAGAESVTHIAEDTKKRSGVVVDASTQAAQTSAQVAAAAEELTASIKEISEQTQKSSQIANEAASKAEFAKSAINLLSEKAMSVAQIIEVITGIAGQINLLALNATIESARAGEAGKGFAVVASEVKNLANQVGKATGEITQQINEMQGATKTSVDSVMDILNIINQVSVSTSAVASAVEEQSAVTTEIANNVARTSSGTQEISQNMSSVQEGAEKTGSTASEVLQSAKNLNQQSGILKQKIDEFLQTIRA